MKKTHIILLVLIAVAIGTIYTTMTDSGTYADFTQASAEAGEEFHVVGKLNRDKEMSYDPQKDPNLFAFYMVDNKGMEKKVILHKTKPADFERSEQIVVIGSCEGNEFHASNILMKCPSKYNEGAPVEKTTSM